LTTFDELPNASLEEEDLTIERKLINTDCTTDARVGCHAKKQKVVENVKSGKLKQGTLASFFKQSIFQPEDPKQVEEQVTFEITMDTPLSPLLSPPDRTEIAHVLPLFGMEQTEIKEHGSKSRTAATCRHACKNKATCLHKCCKEGINHPKPTFEERDFQERRVIVEECHTRVPFTKEVVMEEPKEKAGRLLSRGTCRHRCKDKQTCRHDCCKGMEEAKVQFSKEEEEEKCRLLDQIAQIIQATKSLKEEASKEKEKVTALLEVEREHMTRLEEILYSVQLSEVQTSQMRSHQAVSEVSTEQLLLEANRSKEEEARHRTQTSHNQQRTQEMWQRQKEEREKQMSVSEIKREADIVLRHRQAEVTARDCISQEMEEIRRLTNLRRSLEAEALEATSSRAKEEEKASIVIRQSQLVEQLAEEAFNRASQLQRTVSQLEKKKNEASQSTKIMNDALLSVKPEMMISQTAPAEQGGGKLLDSHLEIEERTRGKKRTRERRETHSEGESLSLGPGSQQLPLTTTEREREGETNTCDGTQVNSRLQKLEASFGEGNNPIQRTGADTKKRVKKKPRLANQKQKGTEKKTKKARKNKQLSASRIAKVKSESEMLASALHDTFASDLVSIPTQSHSTKRQRLEQAYAHYLSTKVRVGTQLTLEQFEQLIFNWAEK
jgi:hypothetical protein